MPDVAGLSLVLRGFGICDAVEVSPQISIWKRQGPFPCPNGQDLPPGAGFIMVKIALIFFVCMGLAARDLDIKSLLSSTEMWPSPGGRRAVEHGGRGLVSTFDHVLIFIWIAPYDLACLGRLEMK